MKLYKYDTHVHTSEASACAISTASQIVEGYFKLGYSGIIITDHFYHGNTCVDRTLPWVEWVELFCKGYENAYKRGKELGIDVFFGWEYNYYSTELLTYGLDKDFLLNNPNMINLDIIDYADLVHNNGGYLVHAHPFREAPYINTIRLLPDRVDAVEIINGNNQIVFNERAKYFADSYGLATTSGSDCHNHKEISGCGIDFKYRMNNIDDLIKAISNKDFVKLY